MVELIYEEIVMLYSHFRQVLETTAEHTEQIKTTTLLEL
jgi:hypothetical protein